MSTSDTTSTSNRSVERSALTSQAFQLEYLTLAWMVIEAAVAIGSGLTAGSLLLTALELIA